VLRSLALAAALTGCALTYSHVAKRCPPTWALAADFAAGAVAAGAAVHAFNATPSHDGTVAALVTAEAFWWTAAAAEDRCRP
jgi:hypothetical protein